MTSFYVRAAAAALLWFFVSASTIAELATLRPAMTATHHVSHG
jgi:hypothetical protein